MGAPRSREATTKPGLVNISNGPQWKEPVGNAGLSGEPLTASVHLLCSWEGTIINEPLFARQHKSMLMTTWNVLMRPIKNLLKPSSPKKCPEQFDRRQVVGSQFPAFIIFTSISFGNWVRQGFTKSLRPWRASVVRVVIKFPAAGPGFQGLPMMMKLCFKPLDYYIIRRW